MPVEERPREPLNLSARVVTAAALVAGAWWSSSWNWAGRTYCEAHHEEFCDGFGFEALAPVILWPITAVVTDHVSLLAAVTAPHAFGDESHGH